MRNKHLLWPISMRLMQDWSFGKHTSYIFDFADGCYLIHTFRLGLISITIGAKS
jgi:hypothetical protein